MELNPVGIDLAKSVFQLSFADRKHQIHMRKRISRSQMHKFILTHEPVHLVMEACATSHYDRQRLHCACAIRSIRPCTAITTVASRTQSGNPYQT